MGILALEDGTIWRGQGFGAPIERVGEVVFCTAMTGYQEVLTDPSYRGQMVVMTVSQVGNTGINPEDEESDRPQVEGFIVRQLTGVTSNWRSRRSLDDYLRAFDVPGLADINTRALTLHLRTFGALRGALSARPDADAGTLVAAARAWPGLEGRDLVREATCPAIYAWREPTPTAWAYGSEVPHPRPLPEGEGIGRPHVVAYDFGIKRNMLRRLTAFGCRVTVVPAATPAEAALALRPDGVLLSNGPGDPAALPYAVAATRGLLDAGVPTLGICLGHQLIGQALGARTFKLKFGHHGGNQPVGDVVTGRVRITSQNHNYAIDPDGLPANVQVTQMNLNDQTVEGLVVTDRPVWSVQYHPEAAPGPHDGDDVLVAFVTHLRREPRG
ncbi:MAG: glutamine-hydrolyzing carbamoyl-phosphate synthase small subunit [Chloroflexi bacterium]|nr:glutamine-hydrolyzing carbamoyl-phosphate synthase small subunit [Chloroflexota bacterium]